MTRLPNYGYVSATSPTLSEERLKERHDSTDLPFRVYLDLYGPPSSFHSLLPVAASCPASRTISSCPILHVRSISPSTCIPPDSPASSSSASSSNAFDRTMWAELRVSSARSFLFAICECFGTASGTGEDGLSDFGRDVCLATELRVRSDEEALS